MEERYGIPIPPLPLLFKDSPDTNKIERVHLLKHILRLIIDPKTQPPSIWKIEGLSVAKLETAAMDSLASNCFLIPVL